MIRFIYCFIIESFFFFFTPLFVGCCLLLPRCWLTIFILLSNLWPFFFSFIIIIDTVARHPCGDAATYKKHARTRNFLWKSYPLRSCLTILKFRKKKNIYLLDAYHLCHSRPTYYVAPACVNNDFHLLRISTERKNQFHSHSRDGIKITSKFNPQNSFDNHLLCADCAHRIDRMICHTPAWNESSALKMYVKRSRPWPRKRKMSIRHTINREKSNTSERNGVFLGRPFARTVFIGGQKSTWLATRNIWIELIQLHCE